MPVIFQVREAIGPNLGSWGRDGEKETVSQKCKGEISRTQGLDLGVRVKEEPGIALGLLLPG